jgi:RNA polymerase sigma-70 factor (ECF subfamily)
MGVTTNAGNLGALDDGTLIKLTLGGQVECFGLLMDRHLAAVRGRIRGMTRGVPDADDIMQEVQLKVWKCLGSFRSESSFRTWMTQIAINETLQFFRRVKHQPLSHDPSELAFLPSPNDSPFHTYVRKEMAHRVRTAVEELPVKYRQVLILRDFQEHSLCETARELQVTLPAVKTRLFRARAALSKALLMPRSRALGGGLAVASRGRASTSKLAA